MALADTIRTRIDELGNANQLQYGGNGTPMFEQIKAALLSLMYESLSNTPTPGLSPLQAASQFLRPWDNRLIGATETGVVIAELDWALIAPGIDSFRISAIAQKTSGSPVGPSMSFSIDLYWLSDIPESNAFTYGEHRKTTFGPFFIPNEPTFAREYKVSDIVLPEDQFALLVFNQTQPLSGTYNLSVRLTRVM